MSARAFLAFLAVCAVIGLLGFGLLSKGEAKIAVGDPVPDKELPVLTGTGRARSPTIAAAGCWSTSGPRGASRAGRRRPVLERFHGAIATTLTVLGINVQDNSDDALAFVRELPAHLPAAALGRRRAQRCLRFDRGPRELPRRPAGTPGADLARPGRRPLLAQNGSCRWSKGAG